MTTASSAARPFLKWAGGKRQLLPQLRRFYPQRFGTYHEPFLGSGAVFFDLVAAGRLRRQRVRLTDVNVDLIGCWLQVRDMPEAVIARLRALASDYSEEPADHYYRIRDKEFNPTRTAVKDAPSSYTPDLAAMLIYLNRTGYNGLFRLNSKGMFNVPRGRYKNPRICDEENIRKVSATLSGLAVAIEHEQYRRVLNSARRGDFVYFDPPYAPLSATAQFTSYTSAGFTTADQQQLQQVVIELAARGCHVLLSNSTAQEITDLYHENPDALRFDIRAHRVLARRAINSKATHRGEIMEYAITNVPALTE